jgi:hypothetical protein
MFDFRNRRPSRIVQKNVGKSLIRVLLCAAVAGASLTAGEPEALAFEANIRARHAPYSMIIDPWLAEPGSGVIQGYTRCGDSALFTGLYLGSQAYRYAVTHDPEARANVMDALNGIRKLVDVTGTDVLARCAVPLDSPYLDWISSEEAPNTIRAGVVDGIPYMWVGNTSRDQYLGVFFGLTAAWNLIPETEVQAWVSMLATRMLNRLMDDGWLVRMPEGDITTTFLGRADHQLALLKLGRRCNPDRFEGAYKAIANLTAYSVPVPIALEVQEPHDSYYKFCLDHIAFFNLLTSGDNWWIRHGYTNGFDLLRKTTDDHLNPFFDLIDTAINGRDASRDERTRASLRAYLQRPPQNTYVDLSGRYPPCLGRMDQTCQVIPVQDRVPADFLWQRSPFQLQGGVWPNIENSHLDYTLPYWMARFYGVLSADSE